jgi:glycosyltransferase involved in cell wall biosynthesis
MTLASPAPHTDMKASVIIRTKNEAHFIGSVLEILTKQTVKEFEIILVDSGSSDSTLGIVDSYKDKLNIKVFNIEPEKFTYPYALNYGCEKSQSEFLVFISGHSVPINEKWLEMGLKDFDDDKIAGVYGPVYPLSNASIWEKMLYYPSYLYRPKKRIIKKVKMGVLGNTNALIRKSLWQEYHFDEKNYFDGGEDGDWAKHFLEKGYIIIDDPAFAVYHSHGLGLIAFIKQYSHWLKLARRFNKN